ncbi:MAG: cache domain-containing protein [Oscillospiraceae bacterium]|nr:cache domain-containing protein [Oscillospiraceae bacterium]
MSKLGRFLVIVVTICIVAAVALLIFINSNQFNTMSEDNLSGQAKVGADLLYSEIQDICNEAVNLNTDFVENDDGFTTAMASEKPKKIEASYTSASKSDGIFCVVYSSKGNVIYQSENAPASIDGAQYINNSFTGYIRDDANLTLYYIDARSVENLMGENIGVSIVGADMASTGYVDSIKEIIGAEVTVFLGDTRLSTTVISEDGQRAVGTQMSDKVKETVLVNQEYYEGRADILGHSHFCCYEPWYDADGNLLGAVFSGIATTESDRQVNYNIINSIVCGVVICIIATLVMTFVSRKFISEPVTLTKKLAEEMAVGNLDYPDFNNKFPANEVGDLARMLEETKHSLSMYVSDMSEVMQSMSEGDFTNPPKVQYSGNFINIRNAMLTIQKQIGDVVGSLKVSAAEVNSGAAQIANGSQLLADGTTKQAAAVQELSATINDISEKIRSNAENAVNANGLAGESKKMVYAQAEDMAKMHEAMDDIMEKSSQVSKIVKTIEDIAFQTNILALNAAVEAARAGAAGKGFAVVADEVRNLATKSDQAAKQTAAIIRETITAVENGSVIVAETEASMEKVVSYTDQTNALIDKISEASKEQADAVRQVTDGVNQISEVVQQNSATAEESAASSEELSGQSNVLMEQVARFKVDTYYDGEESYSEPDDDYESYVSEDVPAQEYVPVQEDEPEFEIDTSFVPASSDDEFAFTNDSKY